MTRTRAEIAEATETFREMEKVFHVTRTEFQTAEKIVKEKTAPPPESRVSQVIARISSKDGFPLLGSRTQSKNSNKGSGSGSGGEANKDGGASNTNGAGANGAGP